MTVKLDQLLMILGGILLAIGLVLGFVPVSENGTSCGTAFTGVSRDAYVADLTDSMMGGAYQDRQGGCEDALSSRRGPALALAIPGTLVLFAGFVIRQRATPLDTGRPGATSNP